MAATAKAPNYTPEQTTEMVAIYTADPSAKTVALLAEMLGKNVRSIVAKLSREKVYVKKEPTDKNGAPVVKKDDAADFIGKVLNMTEAEADSLTKANKTALLKIRDALANSKPIEA